jgi:hypothetical protein
LISLLSRSLPLLLDFLRRAQVPARQVIAVEV